MSKFNPTTLFYVDGYKLSHKKMLAEGTSRLYGTWIPRSTKHAPEGVTKVMSIGQQLTVKWLRDEFFENFFKKPVDEAVKFGKDMSMYLGMDYDASHFVALYNLGYLPIKIKALPEGIETPVNVPHMTFINTVDGFAWLTLYLETMISSLSWKMPTSASIALQYKRNVTYWVNKTDSDNAFLIPWMCHDFSARGLSPWDMVTSGLGHASSFTGSDTLVVIPAARYFYNEPENEVCIGSVNASEHSVSTTKIFTVGEKQMIIDWLKEFPVGILSIVADTFDLWKLLLEYVADPEVKALILARDGKLVIRPDSGNPVDIICGNLNPLEESLKVKEKCLPENLGVIEILWDIFGGTVNSKGYKVLDSHIGCIYGDTITLLRQVQIYTRLANKGFASTNIVLGVGSYTYQMNTRDTLGYAAKGAWFEIILQKLSGISKTGYDIYKDPVTDDGTKKSLRGLIQVFNNRPDAQGGDLLFDGKDELIARENCTFEEEAGGLLQVIFEDGKLYNEITLKEIRTRINSII